MYPDKDEGDVALGRLMRWDILVYPDKDKGDVAHGRLMRWGILVYPDKRLGPVDGNLNDASRVSLHTVDVMQAQHTWCWQVCVVSCMCSVVN